MIDDLYSAKVLKLAADLPHAGRLAAPQGSAERTAKLCGSRIVVDVVLDGASRVADFGQEVQACALGQAAAAVLGANAIGASLEEIELGRHQLRAMLKSGGPAPTGRFADLAALQLVRDYPARHASTLLAFDAAVAAVAAAQIATGAARTTPAAA